MLSDSKGVGRLGVYSLPESATLYFIVIVNCVSLGIKL